MVIKPWFSFFAEPLHPLATDSMTLSIIIPAYNEARTIHLILDKVKAVELMENLQKEVIIVNDCSTDATEDAILTYQKKQRRPTDPVPAPRHQ